MQCSRKQRDHKRCCCCKVTGELKPEGPNHISRIRIKFSITTKWAPFPPKSSIFNKQTHKCGKPKMQPIVIHNQPAPQIIINNNRGMNRMQQS